MAGTSDATALMLKLSADNTQILKGLNQVTKALKDTGPQWERAGKKAAEGLEKGFTGQGFGKALDKVFDSSKLAVLDAGASKIRVFGSALEPLGPAGLAAAAGIAAVAAAFVGAREAARFADDINDTADKLHITTDALQEYRYAIRLAGGQEKGADEALEAFSATLGKAQEGLKKSQRAFLALGFTPEQIKGFKDTDSALQAVTARIQGLPSHQKDAIVEQLGLTGLKELVEGGADQMARLRDEAHRAGIVMDAELVKRGGELNDKFETVAKVIEVQLKSALVDVGPLLLDILSTMADLAKKANEVADAFRGIQGKTMDGLLGRKAELQQTVTRLGVRQLGGTKLSAPEQQALIRAQTELAQVNMEIERRAADGKPPGVPATHTLKDLSPKEADQTRELDAAAQAAADQAAKAARDAEKKLAETIEQRAQLEQDALDAERTAALDKLAAEEAKIRASKNDAHKQEQLALLTKARAEVENKYLAETEALARQREVAIIQRASEQRQAEAEISAQLLQQESEHLSALARLATTTEARNAWEREALKAAQAREDALAQAQVDRAAAELAAATAAKDKDRIATAQQGLQGALTNQAGLAQQHTDQLAEQNVAQLGPVQQYLRSLEDVNHTMQQDGVTAAQELSQALATLATDSKSAGQQILSVFRNLFAKLLEQAIERDAVAPLLHLIPGFASGTNYAPGGLALVGEKGPELVNLPRGSQVTPSFRTLDALAAMKTPQASGVTIVQPFHFHAEGAVLTDELLAQANSHANRVAAQAGQWARSTARQDTQRAAYAGNLNQ